MIELVGAVGLVSLQVAITIVLAWAATGKLLLPAHFANTLRASGVPSRLVTPLSVTIPVLELACAAAILVVPGETKGIPLLAAAALFAAFAVWSAVVLRQSLAVPCSCFGAASRDVSSLTLWRSVGLSAASAAAAIIATSVEPTLQLTSPWLALVAAAAVLLIALGQVLILARPALVLRIEHLDRLDADRPAS